MTVHLSRGPRLAALLRGFGLCPTEVAAQETRAAIVALKAAYYRLAKDEHPDLVPEARKEEAQDRFIKLQGNFEEAMRLLEDGVKPGVYEAPEWARMSRPGEPTQTWATKQSSTFQHREPMKFDLKTRIKGNLVFWTGLFVFLTGFREFLVWSAGSTYAWRPPSNLNPFWVRRFQDEWSEVAKERTEALKKEEDEKKKAAQQALAKTERGVSNFYQKRGISNVRKKTEPRGYGPTI